MKIIELLNKIANGEQVPKKIKLDTIIFSIADGEYYAGEYGSSLIEFMNFYQKDLNKEVEIIEEDKKIEKIGIIRYSENPTEAILHKKIDEIIDYINGGTNGE